MSFIRQHKGAVVWSLALHVAVAVAVVIGVPWRIERPRVPVAAAAPIQGVIIDQAAIERERAAREETARQERVRQQREEQQKRDAAERERQRVATERRQREEAEQRERDRVAAEKAAAERREREAKAEREAQAQREREAAERRAREQAEQRRRQQAESELQQALALEAERNAARDAGLLDQYVRMIENKIKQHWNRPLSARPGIDCVVAVVQLPTGDVMSANVAACNGDDAVRRSIERAVLDASPLPRPPNPTLFERNLNVRFQPDE